jgi:3-deoxy-7-phosphoheptulonate synthase
MVRLDYEHMKQIDGDYQNIRNNCLENTKVTFRDLIPPINLIEDIPQTEFTLQHIRNSRTTISRIINGDDDRLLLVIGPCSIHDPVAALEYGQHLKSAAKLFKDTLFIVMRVYFEKPRTSIGWKGLINDPDLNYSFNINKGLKNARRLLFELNNHGIPCGCEFLDTVTPQYISDLVSWGIYIA